MSYSAEKPRLVMKDNNTSVRENCALCGKSDKANIGPAIFVEGTWNFVCDGCAQRETPGLYEVVILWQREEELRQNASYCRECGKLNKQWWDDQLQRYVCGNCGTMTQTVEEGDGVAMSDAINTEALIATVCDIVDRAEKLLEMQGDKANPGVSVELFALGREIEDLGWELAHAATALQLLCNLASMLERRAAAYAEVYGTPYPGEDDFRIVTSVGLTHFGERFSTPDCDDEGVPF